MTTHESIGRLDDLALGLKPSLLMRRLRDETGEPMTPDRFQQELVDATDPAILALAFRGQGKTSAVATKLLHIGLFEPGRTSAIFSPTDRQSAIALSRVKTYYSQLGGAFGDVRRQSETKFTLANNSEVWSLPGGNPDMVRGLQGLRCAVIDEAARTSEELYAAVLPMLASDGQIVAITTHKSRAAWFAREWRGEGEEEWRRIEGKIENSPRCASKIAAAKRRLTPRQFLLEYQHQMGAGDDGLYPAELIDAAMSRHVEMLRPTWPRFGGRGA